MRRRTAYTRRAKSTSGCGFGAVSEQPETDRARLAQLPRHRWQLATRVSSGRPDEYTVPAMADASHAAPRTGCRLASRAGGLQANSRSVLGQADPHGPRSITADVCLPYRLARTNGLDRQRRRCRSACLRLVISRQRGKPVGPARRCDVRQFYNPARMDFRRYFFDNPDRRATAECGLALWLAVRGCRSRRLWLVGLRNRRERSQSHLRFPIPGLRHRTVPVRRASR